MKKIFIILLLSIQSFVLKAQIYGSDQSIQLPTMSYPSISEVNEMANYALVKARLEHLREENFKEYTKLAYDAYNKGKYNYCLYYSEQALSTNYYSADIYYLRGISFEKLGNYKDAKKEYKRAIRKGSTRAVSALKELKEKTSKKSK